MKFSYFWAKSR